MSSSTHPPFKHRRCSSTLHDKSAIAIASSLPSLATERLTTKQRKEKHQMKVARRCSSSTNLKYTYSFRRSEHITPSQMPPPYDSLFSNQPRVPTYSLSFSCPHTRGSSFAPTPLRLSRPWTPLPNSANRHRAISSPVSPIVSPFSVDETPITYMPYRPSHTVFPQKQSERLPVQDLPSPFSSPLFYWSGQSKQELTAVERIHQAQMEDLSLMSPFGSPSFYWDGVSRQEEHEESTLEKAKKALEKLGIHKLSSIRQTAFRDEQRPKSMVSNEKRRCRLLA